MRTLNDSGFEHDSDLSIRDTDEEDDEEDDGKGDEKEAKKDDKGRPNLSMLYFIQVMCINNIFKSVFKNIMWLHFSTLRQYPPGQLPPGQFIVVC